MTGRQTHKVRGLPGLAATNSRARAHARRWRAWVTAMLILSLAGTAHAARPSSIPPSNQPVVGPQGTLEAIARGYRDRSADSVAAYYTADFRFHSFGDTLLKFVEGIDRAHELAMLHRLFEGVIQGGDTLHSPADSVGMLLDGFDEGVDPEHPDSTQHYRVVVVGRFELGFRTGGTRLVTVSSKHIFHLVRGDVAVLVPGQPAEPDRWYVRRWLEDVSGVLEALRQRQGDCGEPPLPVPGHGSASIVALAIRPQTNPACAKLRVTCDLPDAGTARVEVYDVSGRRVNRRDVAAVGPGSVNVEAGTGAKLAPGAYWLRLSQGTRPPVTRMVMVAK